MRKQAGNGAHKQVESAGGEGRSVVGARQSEEAFLGALRKSEEATHALEASIVELSGVLGVRCGCACQYCFTCFG